MLPAIAELHEKHVALERNMNDALVNIVPNANTGTINKKLTERVEKLENRCENLEISDREDVIILDGIKPCNKDVPLAEHAQLELNANMDIKLDESEVVSCSYIGKPEPAPNGNRRSIKMKTC